MPAQSVLLPLASHTHRLATSQSIILPIKCDADGNLYLRSLGAGPASFNLVQLSPEAVNKATYRYSDAPGMKDAFVHDFSIGGDGKIYELVQIFGKKVFVLRFSADGQFESTRQLMLEETSPHHNLRR